MSLVIGVFGLIGSGKSSVAKQMEEKYGYKHLDCDKLGHWILGEQDTKDKLVKLFGDYILTKEGLIDRKTLSTIVFANKELKSKLEAILWPKMTIQIKDFIKQEKEVVLDAAILFSARWNLLCCCTIYVDTTVYKRDEFIKSRDFSKDLLAQILKSQKEIEKQRPKSTFVIQNEGTYQELMHKVDEVMILIQKRRMEKD